MTSAVVVGSGPNGLAAALTLASSGVKVRVIEAQETLGGGVRSSELTLPGLLHDDCAAFHPMALGSRFASEFGLGEAGLSFGWAEAEFAHPLDGGRGAVAWRSVARTSDGLGSDGSRWQSMFGRLAVDFPQVSGEILQPVAHLPRHPVRLARFGARAMLPATWVAKALREPDAQALFGGVAAHAFRPMNTLASSAIGVALTAAAHAYGWPVAIGGSASIRDAIMKRARQLGVEFETGRRVCSVRELSAADVIMLDTSPRVAADLVGDALPRRVHRAFTRYRHGPGAFKVDFAVAGGVPWTHEDSRRAGTVHVIGSLRETVAAEALVSRGQMPDRPFVLVGQQYLADPSRSKDDVHPVYAYAHVPAHFAGDATEAIVAQIERFAPGFRDRVLATTTTSTEALVEQNENYFGGDIVGGANNAFQLLFRPRPAGNPYATGVPGIYLCSAATPPGAGAHGMCGYNAARSAIASLS